MLDVLERETAATIRAVETLEDLGRPINGRRALHETEEAFAELGAAAGEIAYWGAYAASKAALEVLVRSYAAEVTTTALRVNLLDPGVVRTRMREQAFPGENPADLAPPESVADLFVELAAADCSRHGQVVRAY